MASWIVCLLGLGVSWHYTDLDVESGFQSTFCPIMVAVFLISVLIKFVFLVGPESGGSGDSGADSGGFSGGFGGDDCGGGDGC